MKENRTKRQHIVPRSYLKHFAAKRSKGYFITAYTKGKPYDQLFTPNISGVCVRSDFYTIEGETIEQRLLIEKLYDRSLEQHYDQLYTLLTDPNKVVIGEGERAFVIATLTTMLFRVPHWVEKHSQYVALHLTGVYHQMQQLGLEHGLYGRFHFNPQAETLEQVLVRFDRFIKADQHLDMLQLAVHLQRQKLEHSALSVIKIAESNCELLCSDNPVITVSSDDQNHPLNPAVDILLPLDAKHLVYLHAQVGKPATNYISRQVLSGDVARMRCLSLNWRQYHNANCQLLGSHFALEYYLQRHERLSQEIGRKRKQEALYDDAIAVDIYKELGVL